MKRIGLLAAILAVAAVSAYAQRTFEPAIPRGLPESTVSPSGELPQPAVTPRTVEPAVPQVVEPAVPRVVEPTTPRFGGSRVPQLVMDSRHRRDADARNCLNLASNRQIHRCAERYRPHQPRVTKTVAKPAETTIGAEDRAKAANLAKPDMSKAAEPAKPVDTKAAPSPAPKTAEAPKAAPAPAPAGAPMKKWTDNAKGMFTKGATAADEATK